MALSSSVSVLRAQNQLLRLCDRLQCRQFRRVRTELTVLDPRTEVELTIDTNSVESINRAITTLESTNATT